jgi:hypothetical protein
LYKGVSGVVIGKDDVSDELFDLCLILPIVLLTAVTSYYARQVEMAS